MDISDFIRHLADELASIWSSTADLVPEPDAEQLNAISARRTLQRLQLFCSRKTTHLPENPLMV